MPNIQGNIYIHQNFNRNEIREVLLQNATILDRPTPTVGGDKGLLYFDTDIDRIMIWDGSCWKVVKYLDDRDLKSNEDIHLQNIWSDSYQLVSLDETTSQGVNPYVEYKQDVEVTYLSGTLDFINLSIDDVVKPKVFSDSSEIPSFFDPILKDSNGTIIDKVDSSGKEVWRLIEIEKQDFKVEYRVRFFNVPKYLNNQPLYLTYYEYIGQKLNVSAIGGNINKQVYNANSGSQLISTYEITLLGGLLNEGQVLDISLNGVELPHTAYSIIDNTINQKLIIDTDYLGYEIDVNPPEDCISVNFIS